MKNVDLSNWDLEIMKALLKKGRLSFQQIVDLREDSQFNRNKTREGLNWLIKKGIVREENRSQWKRGQKLWFALTEKGRSILLEKILDSVQESLILVSKLTREILGQPDKVEEWRKASKSAIMNVKITEGMPFEERIRKVEGVDKRTFGLLTESYKNMHRLLCEVHFFKLKQFNPQLDPSQFFIGFTDGALHFVPVQFLKESGLVP